MSFSRKSSVIAAALVVSLGLAGPASAVSKSSAGQRAAKGINSAISAAEGFASGELTIKTWAASTRTSTSTGTSVELAKTPGLVVQRTGLDPAGRPVVEYTFTMGEEEAQFAASEGGLFLPLETVLYAYADGLTSEQEQAIRTAAASSAPGVANPYVQIDQDRDVPEQLGMLVFGYSFFLSSVTPRELVMSPYVLKGSKGSVSTRADGSKTIRFIGKPSAPIKVNGKSVGNYSVIVTAGPDGVMRSYTSKFGKSRILLATWAPQSIVIDLGPTVPVESLPLPS